MIHETFIEPALALRFILVLEKIKSSATLLTEQTYASIIDVSKQLDMGDGALSLRSQP
jgi:hypothetical protein